MKNLFGVICFTLLIGVHAQTDSAATDSLTKKGSLNIEMSSEIAKVIQDRTAYKPQSRQLDTNSIVNGYRLLVFHGTRAQAQKEQSKFKALFPQYATSLKYESPEYKVVAGYFLNRNQANTAWKKVKRYFPAVAKRRDNFKLKLGL